MTDEQKDWIDSASYEMLLRKWRFTPIGDPFFQDSETAEYHLKTMHEKKPDNHSQISKKIGW